MRDEPSFAFTTAPLAMSSSAGDDCRIAAATIEDVLAQDFRGLKCRLPANCRRLAMPRCRSRKACYRYRPESLGPAPSNAEHAADDLRGERFGALPLLVIAGLADHRTLGVQPYPRRHPATRIRAPPTPSKRRAGIGDLDETGNADAAMNVLISQRGLFWRAARNNPSSPSPCS